MASLFSGDNIPAYRIKRIPPFYASLVRTWVDLKGTRDGQQCIVPRPGLDPSLLNRFLPGSVIPFSRSINMSSIDLWPSFMILVFRYTGRRSGSAFGSGDLFALFRIPHGFHFMESFLLLIAWFVLG